MLRLVRRHLPLHTAADHDILSLSDLRDILAIRDARSFRIVLTAQHPIVEHVEPIANAEPVAAVLAREALQVVDITAGAHHHFEGGYLRQTGGAFAGTVHAVDCRQRSVCCNELMTHTRKRLNLPHIIRFAQQSIVTRVQRLIVRIAQLACAIVATQTLIVPAAIHHPQVESILDDL